MSLHVSNYRIHLSDGTIGTYIKIIIVYNFKSNSKLLNGSKYHIYVYKKNIIFNVGILYKEIYFGTIMYRNIITQLH